MKIPSKCVPLGVGFIVSAMLAAASVLTSVVFLSRYGP